MIKIKKKYIWILFIIIKLFYMVIAIGVVSKYTTLGDTFDYFYLNKPQNQPFPYILANSTFYMNLIGHNLYLYFGKYLANIPFIFLSVYGIYYALKRINLSTKELVFIFFMLSLPSFGIWTSICSKESVGVFFMGIILGYLIDLFEKKRTWPNLLELISFYLLLIFKTQYLPAIIYFILYVKISQKLNLKKLGKSLLFIFFIFLFLLTLYIFRDYIQEIAEILPKHFSIHSHSTRENTIWIEKYDIFYHAFEGMIIAFIGPTLDEALSRPMQLIVFIESIFIVIIFLLYFIKLFFKKVINIYFLYITIPLTLLLLFGHYPFGIFNPGSAIRYRENYYAFILIFIIYFYKKNKIFYSRNLNL